MKTKPAKLSLPLVLLGVDEANGPIS